MQKIFNIFFAAVASILFCKNLGINVLTLSPWSVIIWSFKPRVSRNLKLQCRHFFGFNPLCNLTWPSKIEHVLILFWQWLHFLGFSPLCNFRWHPKMQKIFSIFLQQFHLFLFCENLGTNVLTLSLWGVIRWSFKPRVARNLNLLCRHCFGFYPPCNLTRPLKMELVLIPFWQRLHFLAFCHYVISDDISNERYPKINLDSICIISLILSPHMKWKFDSLVLSPLWDVKWSLETLKFCHSF